jgi:methylated-DNA-protein-cysteine methyltransferase-like protein
MTKSGERFSAIYALAKEIPPGKVASYGMLASLIPGVTARIAGYAMAGVSSGEDIPWHRVINSAGKISERDGAERQRKRLESEGVIFSSAGKIKWLDFGWEGPSQSWLDANGLDPIDFMTIRAGWPR